MSNNNDSAACTGARLASSFTCCGLLIFLFAVFNDQLRRGYRVNPAEQLLFLAVASCLIFASACCRPSTSFARCMRALQHRVENFEMGACGINLDEIADIIRQDNEDLQRQQANPGALNLV